MSNNSNPLDKYPPVGSRGSILGVIALMMILAFLAFCSPGSMKNGGPNDAEKNSLP